MRTIKFQLFMILACLMAGFLLAAGMAWNISRAANAQLQSVFADRVVPLNDLKAVSDAYAVSIVDNAHKIRSGEVSYAQGGKEMDLALVRAGKAYTTYMGTRMSGEEKALADQVAMQLLAVEPAVTRLRDIVRREDQASMVAYVDHDLYPAIDPITANISRLTDLQVVEAKKSYDLALTEQSHMILALVVIVALGAAAAIGGLVIVIRRIVGPIKQMTEAMKHLAEGDLSTHIPASTLGNEISDMAEAMLIFKANAETRVQMEATQARDEEARAQRARHIETLVRAFDATVSEITTVVSSAATELEVSAQSLTSGAEETSKQSIAVSAASEEAAMNVQTVAAAAEEMSASVREIGRQVEESASISASAVAHTIETAEIVRRLSHNAQGIGDVIKLITDVAGQTNLLALNATIEAARAGAAGSGFAVVAGEVKQLAQQTSRASAQIAAQIMQIQQSTEEAVQAIEGISATISTLSDISGSIAQAVGEQSVTTDEIARNVQQASDGADNVSSNIAGVSRATEETSAAASQVLSASAELARQSALMRQTVGHFIAEVRAA
jgi:methyl-accepting chemotaxis protein